MSARAHTHTDTHGHTHTRLRKYAHSHAQIHVYKHKHTHIQPHTCPSPCRRSTSSPWPRHTTPLSTFTKPLHRTATPSLPNTHAIPSCCVITPSPSYPSTIAHPRRPTSSPPRTLLAPHLATSRHSRPLHAIAAPYPHHPEPHRLTPSPSHAVATPYPNHPAPCRLTRSPLRSTPSPPRTLITPNLAASHHCHHTPSPPRTLTSTSPPYTIAAPYLSTTHLAASHPHHSTQSPPRTLITTHSATSLLRSYMPLPPRTLISLQPHRLTALPLYAVATSPAPIASQCLRETAVILFQRSNKAPRSPCPSRALRLDLPRRSNTGGPVFEPAEV